MKIFAYRVYECSSFWGKLRIIRSSDAGGYRSFLNTKYNLLLFYKSVKQIVGLRIILGSKLLEWRFYGGLNTVC